MTTNHLQTKWSLNQLVYILLAQSVAACAHIVDQLSALGFAVQVPQGSILGPILLLLYTADLLQLISRHLLHPHEFADDTQIHGVCNPSTTNILCQSLSACINDASRWLKSNRLLFNPAKTEIL